MKKRRDDKIDQATVAELFPQIADDKRALEEATANLERYSALLLRMYNRIQTNEQNEIKLTDEGRVGNN